MKRMDNRYNLLEKRKERTKFLYNLLRNKKEEKGTGIVQEIIKNGKKLNQT